MLVQVIEINDVRNHDETKGEIAKKKKTSPTKLLSPEGCPYEYVVSLGNSKLTLHMVFITSFSSIGRLQCLAFSYHSLICLF